MKALILAAGRGERMRPLTDTTPKPLLKAGGKPLVVHILKRLVNAGVSDVVINLAHLGEQIEQTLQDGEQFGVRIRYSWEAQALETAGGIVQALPLLEDSSFIVVNGDIWTDYDFTPLVSGKLDGDLAKLVMVDNPAHNPGGDFVLINGRLQEDGSPKLTYSGIGLYSSAMFTNLSPGKRALAPILRKAISNSQVSGEKYSGRWWDIGTPERLQELDTLLSG